MSDLKRLKKLAGLSEADVFGPYDDMDHDPDEAEQDARYEREQKIVKLIHFAFQKIGLTIANDSRYPVIYDEATGREARVELEDNEFPLSVLERLKGTGLADDYTIRATAQGGMDVEFVVREDMDHATL